MHLWDKPFQLPTLVNMSISQDRHIQDLQAYAIRFGDYATVKFWEQIFNEHVFSKDLNGLFPVNNLSLLQA